MRALHAALTRPPTLGPANLASAPSRALCARVPPFLSAASLRSCLSRSHREAGRQRALGRGSTMRAAVLLLAALLGAASAQRCRQVARKPWVGSGTGGDIAALSQGRQRRQRLTRGLRLHPAPLTPAGWDPPATLLAGCPPSWPTFKAGARPHSQCPARLPRRHGNRAGTCRRQLQPVPRQHGWHASSLLNPTSALSPGYYECADAVKVGRPKSVEELQAMVSQAGGAALPQPISLVGHHGQTTHLLSC